VSIGSPCARLIQIASKRPALCWLFSFTAWDEPDRSRIPLPSFRRPVCRD
jgi:hypothetical protein